MDQLTGPNVQVVLSLKEGKGFDKIKNPTFIVATLNGLSLETNLIDPDANPQYETDFVWEASKNALRQMRSGQEPLKIECFEFKENGTKDKIGYLLLSMRTAQIIGRGNDHNFKVNWHKLSGLRADVRAYRPELYISFTIEKRDQCVAVASRRRDMSGMNKISSSDIETPYLIDEEHLIQLGPINTCRDVFLLSIITGKIANLDQLMKKSVHQPDPNKSYSFWYYILDNEVQSKSFTYNAQVRALDEKITIRIRSCHDVLKNYFENKSQCFVILRYGDDVIAESEINLRPLISTNNLEEFIKTSDGGVAILNEHCPLKPLNNSNDASNPQDEPYFDVQMKLQYTGLKTMNDGLRVDTTAEIHKRPSSCNHLSSMCSKDSRHMMRKTSDIETHRHPGGDCQRCSSAMLVTSSEMNEMNHMEQPGKRPGHIHTCSSYDNSKSIEPYRCYWVHIKLDNMKLRSHMSMKNIEFRFHHPKAEVMSTLHPKIPISSGEQVRLHDIGCKLHFISTVGGIRHLLQSFPPKVSVCNGDQDDTMCLGQTILDVDRVFDEKNLACQYETSLLNESLQEVGSIQVTMHLEDQGPYHEVNKRMDENLGPPILDDSLAYKIVDELETWKERQQELFRLELKRKEERHLTRLSEEWQIRREALESKLNCSMEQCKLLANSLNDASDDLRARKLQSLEKEARLIKANEDLKWSYDRKLQELEDASRKMQQDFTSRTLVLEEQKKNLEAQIESIKNENLRLQTLVKKQSEDIATHAKGSMTQDQIDSLVHEMKVLESKLNSAQKSKIFFKEQWGKAVREIHKMKMVHRQAIEVQIESSKQKLKNIDLEQLLHADSAALTNDKILLGQLQKEIDVIKPKPSFVLNDQLESVFTPSNNSASLPRRDYSKAEHSSSSNEQDERLRKLIEERDSLLRTGSYTIDDAIIVKLNTEIRSMLINS